MKKQWAFFVLQGLEHLPGTEKAEGDGVLVKGSRGMKMETVIREIEKKRETERRRAG